MSQPDSNRGPLIAEHVVLACTSLLLLEQHSRLPESNLLLLPLCSGVIFVIGASYCGHLMVAIDDRVTGRTNRVGVGLLKWLVFPVTLALVLSSAVTHWPASVRFALSRSSFEELVSDAYQGKQLDGFPRRVGLYWIEYVYDLEFNYATREGTIGFVTGSCLIDGCGLCYDPRDVESSHWLTTRIAPCWYVTEW